MLDCGCLENVVQIDRKIRTTLAPDKILVYDFETHGRDPLPR